MQEQIDQNRQRLLAALKKKSLKLYFATALDEASYAGVSIDDPSRISFAPRGVDRYDYKKRQITTLGRYCTRVLRISPDCDDCANAMAEFTVADHHFAIRDDVYDVYNDSDMPDSCMTNMDCVKWYEEIGTQVLTYREQARALLWHGKYIDRIYPNDPAVVAAYGEYAERHGLVVLDKNTYEQIWPGETLTVLAPLSTWGYPYMDTLRHATLIGGKIQLSTGPGDLCLNRTDGASPQICDLCGGLTFNNLVEVDGKNRCEHCAVNANRCKRCDELTFNNLVEVDGEDCCESCAEESYICDRCDTLTFNYPIEVDGKDRCEHCAVNANRCNRCNKLTFNDLVEVNGEDCCESCAEAGVVTLIGDYYVQETTCI